MRIIKPFAWLALLFVAQPLIAQKVSVKSPDGNIRYQLTLTNGRPVYRVSYKGNPIINNSSVGLAFKDSGNFASNLKMLKPVYKSGVEQYDLVVGKTKHVNNSYEQAIVPLAEINGLKRSINIVVRVFNDGLAFRYEFPQQKNWSAYTLTDENSEFNVAGDPQLRILSFKTYNNAHEGLYEKVPLSKLKKDALVDMPALFEFPDKVYMAITEASLRDYAGMYLGKHNGGLISKLSPLPGQTEIKVKAVIPHHTPWRVMMISDRVGALIESNIITDLNEPSKIKDVSWIKPGKTSFHWWNGDVMPDTSFMPGVNFEFNKYYIDFCARNHIQYHSVIGYGGFAWYSNNWPGYGTPGTYSDVTKPVGSLDMQKVCDYAKSKGVGIHVWVHWQALYPQLEEAFTQFEKWGIKGMMVDFLNRDDQQMVKIQEEILQHAAAHHLFIQFHGAYKPTGLSRTYPNEFTREGTYNYENNKWLPQGLPPEHDLDIAFTRLLAGPTDYHLGGFRAVAPDEFKTHFIRPMMIGTRCHMLAMYVVMESYLHMVADYPEAYEGQPGFDFVKAVPTVWDETKVINAEPGQYLTVARRHGTEWYVGTINNSQKRNLKISLDFLPKGNYRVELYQDAPDDDKNPNHLIKSIKILTDQDIIEVAIAAGGGQAIHLMQQ
ncbi:glycoside hydrolase family 97 protein [Mucilaginibacter panaciglaebae]|uniref:Glycoside hydrolase family 97 protein n=1 Tax=Mucilaginibacter panaciglaebae TaxID=502331 RepID=A0ABP7X471_9SPHI